VREAFSQSALVQRRRDAVKHTAMTLDDGVRGLRPGEWRWALVPAAHVGGEVPAAGAYDHLSLPELRRCAVDDLYVWSRRERHGGDTADRAPYTRLRTNSRRRARTRIVQLERHASRVASAAARGPRPACSSAECTTRDVVDFNIFRSGIAAGEV
jgi:hypothetical protein